MTRNADKGRLQCDDWYSLFAVMSRLVGPAYSRVWAGIWNRKQVQGAPTKVLFLAKIWFSSVFHHWETGALSRRQKFGGQKFGKVYKYPVRYFRQYSENVAARYLWTS